MSARGEYNTNLLLTTDPHQGTSSYWLSPAAKFMGSTEAFSMNGKLAGDFVQYYGDKDATIYNLYFPISAQYRGERNTWDFNGGLTRDNTLMAELLRTGLVLAFTQRNLWTANPSWTYNLTERLALQSGYQYQKATYEDGLRLGLVDYELHNATETASYDVSPTDSIQLTGIFTRFLAPAGRDLVSDTYGVQLGGTHAFTENTSISASGGPRYIMNSINSGSQELHDHSTVWVFSGNFRTRFERAQVALDIGRDIYPSGFGVLIQTDHAGITIGYELTDKVAVSLSGQAALSSSVISNALVASFPENLFWTATPKVNWRIGEYWSIETSYTYSHREIEGQGDLTVGSHVGRLMLTYTPPKWSVAR